ncbi:MAG: hypothetical protein OXF27_07585 [Acidobacteria bacterium]|nr:hypothetical protein [Acidobacteriota bacterium]
MTAGDLMLHRILEALPLGRQLYWRDTLRAAWLFPVGFKRIFANDGTLRLTRMRAPALAGVTRCPTCGQAT